IAGEARWEMTGPKGIEVVDVPARLVGDHIQLVIDATLAGLGIAQMPTFFAEPHVAAGTLVALLPRYSVETPLHILTHASRHLPRRVALIRDFLADHLASSCKAHCLK
ncbi:MAG: LysR substrate-binding domain-containing protein, partial [Kofleriaceae bacterium]